MISQLQRIRVVFRYDALIAALMLLWAGTSSAAQVVITGPAGSSEFGHRVTTLPNGNIVVIDPSFDAPGPIADVGAVYLYRPDGVLISTLRGSKANDQVGSGGITALNNGNYVVSSPVWDSGAVINVGAVTFGSGVNGSSGVVSSSNSLVGTTADDRVGSNGIIALSNGNYVVPSTLWDNGAASNAGAVTFGSGVSGISGVVSVDNSLVGSTANNFVGGSGVTALNNGQYVVLSAFWDNGAVINVGAATFGSGVSGIRGVVSASNSLVGTTADDRVGSNGVTALGNGNYVVLSPDWDNSAASNAGAATFGSGVSGISGVVSVSNSLVGITASDFVGRGSVITLSNSNYVVRSPDWDNGATSDAGAVTFGSGVSGISGLVSASNSLVGSTANDRVGIGFVSTLSNSNYVVNSPDWDNGAASDAGAVTFGSGVSGISGLVSASNSLVGSTASDQIGNFGVARLSNGNYVVNSPDWDNGAVSNVGAATFGSGVSGISGLVSVSNSLVGTTAADRVGSNGVIALSNGHYVVNTSKWDNGAVIDVGAATFGSGVSGISGLVSVSNSLVGSTANDRVGSGVVTVLSTGNYVVLSPDWDNGAASDAGAATFGSGVSGISGLVSASNSLVGSTANDRVGSNVVALSNGNYVVSSPGWNNGVVIGVGAVTFGSGVSGISGLVSASNSLVGSTVDDQVGGGVSALSTGNYVVLSPSWDTGAIIDAGAATFGSGVSGISGVVSVSNSLVGSTANDGVGNFGVSALSNGHYVLRNPYWDNGAIINAGAITLALANGNVTGPLTSTHSVLGLVADGGFQLFAYDALRNQLAVGQPLSNRVVLQRTGIATAISIISDTPDPSTDNQPVTFTATVSAAPSAPSDGQVSFRASSGESCTDTTPTAISPNTANFSCSIVFTSPGNSTVIAEYTGSLLHAYSGSGPEPHTSNLMNVFANGFEN